MKSETVWSENEESKGIRKGLLWIGISTGIILALIIATAWILTDDAHKAWEDANWFQLAIGWFLMCTALWALGHRWKALLPAGSGPSGAELGAALCGALLLNYALPGPFGEVAAAHHIHKRHNIPFATTLASGTVARLAGLFTAAVGALLLSSTTGAIIDAEHRWALWMCLGGITGGGSLLALLFWNPAIWDQIKEKEDVDGFKPKLAQFLRSLARSVAACSEKKALSKAFAWSVLGHFLAGAGLAISVYALFGIGNWEGLAISYLLGTCLGAVAFLFPGSQVAWDALMAGLLKSTAGLSGIQAVGAALTLRIEQLWMMGLGALSLKWLGRLKPMQRKTLD